MNNQEFFRILVGEPPLEVELEIEMKCREVEELPESIMKAYCFALVKENKFKEAARWIKATDFDAENEEAIMILADELEQSYSENKDE